MEDLAALLLLPLLLAGEWLVLLIADIFGLIMGLGWRHYSKKRKAAKEAAGSLTEAPD